MDTQVYLFNVLPCLPSCECFHGRIPRASSTQESSCQPRSIADVVKNAREDRKYIHEIAHYRRTVLTITTEETGAQVVLSILIKTTSFQDHYSDRTTNIKPREKWQQNCTARVLAQLLVSWHGHLSIIFFSAPYWWYIHLRGS